MLVGQSVKFIRKMGLNSGLDHSHLCGYFKGGGLKVIATFRSYVTTT